MASSHDESGTSPRSIIAIEYASSPEAQPADKMRRQRREVFARRRSGKTRSCSARNWSMLRKK